ncbi:g-protein coupled receptor GRL101 [Trichonephila inaurata madagascariensis]|uniref:G-protein coupled receptor GRL101 n=1 Tax=Trichonephila inaurata madagascariensis TaxID=2747483 RepID=A0A8X6YZ02_9ARAC|nr:g-protein coupled receptor GRL101 [Trichonephila inaurata madagascariensis]
MILRICVWLVAGLAGLGNICVIIGRALQKETNRVHSFYIKHLAIADFLMSLYLFVIAGHDAAYRGEYIHHDASWRHSWKCSLAGILCTLSSEASIFMLMIITTDRNCAAENFIEGRLEDGGPRGASNHIMGLTDKNNNISCDNLAGMMCSLCPNPPDEHCGKLHFHPLRAATEGCSYSSMEPKHGSRTTLWGTLLHHPV